MKGASKAKRDKSVDGLVKRYLEEAAKREFEPYVKQIAEGFKRSFALVEEAGKIEPPIWGDMLRAVVVLNHAYLEDFLRTLAVALLPTAGEKALDGIPLAGAGRTERAEKFYLGRLYEHRGKTVNDVLVESVRAHIERSTFNSVSEIMGFIQGIGLSLPKKGDLIPAWIFPLDDDVLSRLDEMIRRRHHIVHRADKADRGEGLRPITEAEVLGGMVATQSFMLCVATTAFAKRYSFEEIKKRLSEMAAEAKKLSLKHKRAQSRRALDGANS